MRVLMVGVDRTIKGGMWSVVQNYLSDAEFRRKTNLIYIPTATSGSIPKRLIFSAKGFLSIHKLLKHQKVDIIHIHMAEKGSTFRTGIIEKIGRRYGCKIVLQIHAEYKTWYSGNGRFVRRIIRNILNGADRLLILGEYWRTFFSGLVGFSTKIDVLYNGISQPPSNPYQENAPYLLYLGVLNRQKGIFDLLTAVKSIDNRLPDSIKLAVCGLDENGVIYQTVKNMGLNHRVEMKGWVDAERKTEILRHTCVNILPSYTEALPMSVLETMANGIPNIATGIAAVPEIIENGKNGILVHPGSPEELAQSIERLVLNRWERVEFSRKAYQTVCERFSLDRQKKRLLAFYGELLQEESR